MSIRVAVVVASARTRLRVDRIVFRITTEPGLMATKSFDLAFDVCTRFAQERGTHLTFGLARFLLELSSPF